MPFPPTRTLVRAAAGAYVANCALGSAVALRIVDTSRFRWVHHALFVGTAALTMTAVAVGLSRRSTPAAVLAPALLPLAFIPYIGMASHVPTAVAAAPWFTGSVLLSRGE